MSVHLQILSEASGAPCLHQPLSAWEGHWTEKAGWEFVQVQLHSKAERLGKLWSRMSCKLYSLDDKPPGLWSSNPCVSRMINPIIKYGVVFLSLFQRLSFTFLFIFCLLSQNVKRGWYSHLQRGLSHSQWGLSLVPLSLLARIMHWFKDYFKINQSHREKWREPCSSGLCLMLPSLNSGRRHY